MAHVSAADLLVGSDEDFVINLYLAVLGRWPDAAGLAYFVGQLAADPDGRPGVITELATSPEAMQHGQALAMPDPLLPAEPIQALGAQLALRSEFLHRLASTPPPVAPAPMDAVAPLLRELLSQR